MTYKGFIATIIGRDVPARGRKAATKAYSFKLELEDGNEVPEWFGYGFKEPPFKEGQYVQFDAENNERGFLTVIEGTGSSPKNPPARKQAKQSTTATGGGAGTGGAGRVDTGRASQSDANGADRQTQIVLQHSQEIAIRAVAALLQHSALPMTGAATKAGEAKRFAEITAMIDKLTVRYYNDVVTARLLTIVADTVPSTAPDGPLPTATPGKKAKAETGGSGDDLASDGEQEDGNEGQDDSERF